MSRMNRVGLGAIALACFLSVASSSRAEEAGVWTTDFAAAQAKAKAEKKLLLVDFTGSDWCGWCMKLKKEVFSTEKFEADAPKQFVCVELDYPHKTKLSEELTKQNEDLLKKYKISGYPTILLLDPDGEIVAHTGYRPGGPESYIKHLSGFVDAYAVIVKGKPELDTVKGLDRAKLLDQLIVAYGELGVSHSDFTDWSKEIVSLDADNKAGLRLKYEFRLLIVECNKLRGESKLSEAKAVADKALAMEGISATSKQTGYMADANLCFAQKDYAGIVKWLEKSVEVDPASPQGIEAKTTMEKFKVMAETDAAIAKIKSELETAEGVQRAKLLDSLIGVLTKIGPVGHDPARAHEIAIYKKEIIALDKENKAGLLTKYEYGDLVGEIASYIKAKDWDKAETAVAKAQGLPGLSDEQKAVIEKSNKQLQALKSKAEKTAAL